MSAKAATKLNDFSLTCNPAFKNVVRISVNPALTREKPAFLTVDYESRSFQFDRIRVRLYWRDARLVRRSEAADPTCEF